MLAMQPSARSCLHASQRAGTRAPTPRARLLIALLAWWLGACGGDDGVPSVAESRGSESDAGAAGDAALRVKVLNVGEPCSLLAHGSCRGEAAQCLEISYSGAFYTGGYCTADCGSSVECGPGAECPVGEAEQLEPGYDVRSTWARKCFKSCSPGVSDSCRFGYACMSLAEAYEADDAPAPLQRNVCIPRAPTFSDPHADAGRLD